MPALQTTYTAQHAPFVEGMVANMEKSNIISRNVETAAGIGFGKVAVQGTGANQIRVSEASRVFRGITVLDTTQLQDSYPQYATAAVLTKGVIVVSVAVTVAAGEPAYFVPATGVITNVSTSNTLIPNAMFDSSGTGLVKLRIG